MFKRFRPVLIIAVAVALAGGAAFYMSKQPGETAVSSASSPTQTIAGGGARVRGPQNASITLIEFGDYQCPSCGYYAPIVAEVLRRYPKDVRLEFHHFPLIQLHQYAMAAALAAEAAADQGKFWEMHDLLYEHQDAWSRSPNAESEFVSYASKIGLNVNQFMQSVRSPVVNQRVLEDVVKAREFTVNETPTFFVNGQKVTTKPQTVDEFSKLIETTLRNK